jgi:hypothetical protein
MSLSDDITLVYNSQYSIGLHTDETPDTATINRACIRLLANDTKLREYVEDIFNTEIGDPTDPIPMLTGSIGTRIDINEVGVVNAIIDYFDTNDVEIPLGNLTDVDISNPILGEVLTYSSSSNTWGNAEAVDTAPIVTSFIESVDVVYNGIDHELGLYQKHRDTIEPGIFIYDMSAFTVDGVLVPSGNIHGLVVQAVNFTALTGGSAYRANTTQVDLDGQGYHYINGVVALDKDDDGGVISNTIVHTINVDETTFKINLTSATQGTKSAEILGGIDGMDENSFKIVGLVISEGSIELTPSVSIEYIQGNVISTDTASFNTGFVSKASANEPPYGIWSSTDPSATVWSLWESVLPVSSPSRTAKTEIEFENYAVSGGDRSFAVGKIYIDWIGGTVRGHFTHYKGESMTTIGSGVISGSTGSDIITTSASEFSGGNVRCGISTSSRNILGLPIVVDIDNVTVLGKVSYAVRHFNVDKSGAVATTVFNGTTANNVDFISHNLGVVPDMFSCTIEGVDVTTLTGANTGSGVTLHGHVAIKADINYITLIDHFGNALTTGERKFVAIALPQT